MSGRYYIRTYGCQMNEYDSARMADVLRESAGLTETQEPAEADLLLINTCSVREKAQEKVFSLLGEWREYKRRRPEVIIGVGGCVASQEGEGITVRAPFVDLVFGPQTLHRLPDMIAQLRRQGRAVVAARVRQAEAKPQDGYEGLDDQRERQPANRVGQLGGAQGQPNEQAAKTEDRHPCGEAPRGRGGLLPHHTGRGQEQAENRSGER